MSLSDVARCEINTSLYTVICVYVYESHVFTVWCLLSTYFSKAFYACVPTWGFVNCQRRSVWLSWPSSRQEQCSVDNSILCVDECVFTRQWERNGSGKTVKSGRLSVAAGQPTWLLFLRRVSGLCWLTSDLSVSSPSLYGGFGFQGANLGWNRCRLP